MIQLNDTHYNMYVERMVEIICSRTGNSDKNFFRPICTYFLAKIASSMRCNVVSECFGTIPVNCYTIGLANSGYGKNFSINIIEDEVINGFKQYLTEVTMEQAVKLNIQNIINASYNLDSSAEQGLLANYNTSGEFLFSFDNGTSPAIKQFRNKLLIGGCGAISSEQDEIGSNLTSNMEVLNLFLELYDLGKVKQKLIKNSNENKREPDRDGRVPTNLLMFGTPSKLFDGGETEDTFFELLETGYARRCLFGYGIKAQEVSNLSCEEVYESKVQANNHSNISDLSKYFTSLAHISHLNKQIRLEKDEGILLTQYQIECKQLASQIPEHEFIRKAELEHRYFKVLKIAGAYAFVRQGDTITKEDLLQAMKVVEDSGESFNKFLQRDPDYVRVAKYLANKDETVTHADINEVYPWYKTSTKRKEIMALARAWGYKNNVLIKEFTQDGIEFFKADKLEETNLNSLKISSSENMANNFVPITTDFNKLIEMCNTPSLNGYYWCNHYFKDNHRNSQNVKEGFNLLALDCDGGVSIETVQDILKKYTYILHTTASHTPENHRFRVIIPIKYNLTMARDQYRAFMGNVLNYLPFPVDTRCQLPEQMWALYGASSEVVFNQGDLFDPLPFIPHTARNEEYLKKRSEATKLKLDKLDTWFYHELREGNRNNLFYRYGMMLVDAGYNYDDIRSRIINLNKKIECPLHEDEIDITVMRSIDRKLSENE